ncbi:MAG: glycosyltransferase, partial [Lactobacillus crispatus]|nr:glycosyltransferase [Lactobacillus crispatus]
FVIVRKLIVPGSSILGWASTISIILLIGGLQLLCIGIIGRYIGKIYLQVKERPIYIVKEEK